MKKYSVELRTIENDTIVLTESWELTKKQYKYFKKELDREYQGEVDIQRVNRLQNPK